jgi:hypothetical protein
VTKIVLTRDPIEVEIPEYTDSDGIKHERTVFKISCMDAFPPNSNPFLHDLYHMGQKVGSDLWLMTPTHSHHPWKYLIFVDESTGQRVLISKP